MYRKIMLLMIAGLLTGNLSMALNKKEKQVAKAVDDLKAAMISADSEKLASLVSDDLIYGHSGGKVEDKTTFIQTLVSGRSDFVSIELSEQTITIYDKAAVVRHILNATTNDNGNNTLVQERTKKL